MSDHRLLPANSDAGRFQPFDAGLKLLRSDEPLQEILRSEGLSDLPPLEGTYSGLSERLEVTSRE